MSDVEVAARAGVAPARSSAPLDREGLLLPLTMRERVAVASFAEALTRVGEMPETPETLRIWQCLSAGFANVTGVQWTEAPWF